MTLRLLNIILTFLLLSDLQAQSADTINKTDINGQKQGHWIHYQKYNHYTCADTTKKAEEGYYKDNKKVGLWKVYYCSDIVRNEITFVDGEFDGPFKLFYDNGKLHQEGTMKKNHWIGAFKTYKEDGTVKEQYYNDKGKRTKKPK